MIPMDNGFIFPYRCVIVISYGGTRQGRPERGSTVQARPGSARREIRERVVPEGDGERWEAISTRHELPHRLEKPLCEITHRPYRKPTLVGR